MNVKAALKSRRTGNADGPPPRLGEILVGRQALDQRRLEAALARQPVSGRRLGDLLVARG